MLQVEEQTKVIQAITSVIQALSPGEAIGPVEVSKTSFLPHSKSIDLAGHPRPNSRSP